MRMMSAPPASPGRQRQPAGVVPHQLDDHDAQMRLGRRIEPVDRLGRGADRGVEAEGDVGFGEVVVDGLGQADDVEAVLGQAVGDLVRAVAAQADQAIEAEPVVGFDGPRASCRWSRRWAAASCAASRGWCRGWCRRATGCRRRLADGGRANDSRPGRESPFRCR